jgi:hypothetical protein
MFEMDHRVADGEPGLFQRKRGSGHGPVRAGALAENVGCRDHSRRFVRQREAAFKRKDHGRHRARRGIADIVPNPCGGDIRPNPPRHEADDAAKLTLVIGGQHDFAAAFDLLADIGRRCHHDAALLGKARHGGCFGHHGKAFAAF